LVAIAGASLQLPTIAVGHRQTIGKERNVEKAPLQGRGNFDPISGIEESAELALRMAPECVAMRAIAGNEEGGKMNVGGGHIQLSSKRMASARR
jgi:hypothetical protein